LSTARLKDVDDLSFVSDAN